MDYELVSYYWSDNPPVGGRLHVFVKLPDSREWSVVSVYE